MASFKKMRADGVIKRADAEKIRWEDIHIEPGFNLQGRNEDKDEDDEALYQHIMRGGTLPDLEVRPREEGGVWIVDGHRRHIQLGRAEKDGARLRDPKDGQFWICVVQFTGNDVERTKRLLTSNANKQATQLQVAEVYARLSRFGLTPDQIGEEFTKTRQHVDQLLILAGANNDVHQQIKDGVISATEAIGMVRTHGELAGAFIAAALDDNGGRKVTAKQIKPWSPPKTIIEPLVFHLDAFEAALPVETRAALQEISLHPDDYTVQVPAAALYELMAMHTAIGEARVAALDKIAARNSKAAQALIEGA